MSLTKRKLIKQTKTTSKQICALCVITLYSLSQNDILLYLHDNIVLTNIFLCVYVQIFTIKQNTTEL